MHIVASVSFYAIFHILWYANAYQPNERICDMNETNPKSTDSFGFLKFEVASGDGTIPIRDAVIYVYDMPENEGKASLLFSLTTDADGQTKAITLPAPPILESLSPGMETPFYSYPIVVKKSGFVPIDGREVPVFPGITSIQGINMIAELEPTASSESEVKDD